ncbi:MAG: acyl-CoA dehydrogenase family protein [Flavobacteriales bacterium]|nr:acyl-CoA dehydrogenase family protein [Flavobacteriales bacterium]MDW8431220.1 acyl-CoA dehydrogenase family protein [Flavobacteriales bacterium]
MSSASVLQPGFHRSSNFYDSDQWLHRLWREIFPPEICGRLEPLKKAIGQRAATDMEALARAADRHPPELVLRNWYGEDIQEIRFHPAYRELQDIAVHSGMFRLKWQPEVRRYFEGFRHAAGFAVGFYYAMAENGLYCPLCMTDGAALLVDKYGDEADKKRLLPRIYTEDPNQFITGAMFLTEKAGGSDVGANQCTARRKDGPWYLLNGEKWFCSNANAEVAFVLARTRPDVPGTRGLSIFLVEPMLPDGTPNPRRIIRLKDKLGVRSMASAEILLTDTVGKLYGEEGQGFKIMADMINLSRLYNAVTAVADQRRALIEAWQFLSYRHTFGRPALSHALVRKKCLELLNLYLADLALLWRAIQAYDRAECGQAHEALLARLLTPMVKKCTAWNGVYVVRECMELIGGMGYIEDGVMPRLMRDCMVLPIWEGAGNIMVLDMMRALAKNPEILDLLPTLEGFSGAEEILKACRALQNSDAWNQSDPELILEPLLQDLEAALKKSCLRHFFGDDRLIEKLIHSQNPVDFSTSDLEHLMGWSY